MNRTPLRTLAILLALCTAGAPPALSQTSARTPPRAAAPIDGVLRISGPPVMKALLRRWERDFRRTHPDIVFHDRLKSRDTAIYGIEMRTAEIALLDRSINPFERYGTYEHSWIFPVEIEIATDGMVALDDPATEAVFVRADNPLRELTLAQLDGIFGAQRDGGFDRLSWLPANGRPASANIRNWTQLGIGGALAGRPINVYGPASHGNGVVTHFQQRVLKGGAMRNEALREYADPTAMFAAMATDPLAIGYGPLGAMPAGFRAIALSEGAGRPFVRPTRATLADRSYPLARPIFAYFTIDTPSGGLADPRVDPRVMAFVSYILSPAGQAIVRTDGRYLPLAPAMARRQLDILRSDAPPAERPH